MKTNAATSAAKISSELKCVYSTTVAPAPAAYRYNSLFRECRLHFVSLSSSLFSGRFLPVPENIRDTACVLCFFLDADGMVYLAEAKQLKQRILLL